MHAWLLSARKCSLAKPLFLRFISLKVEPLTIILLLPKTISRLPSLSVVGVSLVVRSTTLPPPFCEHIPPPFAFCSSLSCLFPFRFFLFGFALAFVFPCSPARTPAAPPAASRPPAIAGVGVAAAVVALAVLRVFLLLVRFRAACLLLALRLRQRLVGASASFVGAATAVVLQSRLLAACFAPPPASGWCSCFVCGCCYCCCASGPRACRLLCASASVWLARLLRLWVLLLLWCFRAACLPLLWLLLLWRQQLNAVGV